MWCRQTNWTIFWNKILNRFRKFLDDCNHEAGIVHVPAAHKDRNSTYGDWTLCSCTSAGNVWTFTRFTLLGVRFLTPKNAGEKQIFQRLWQVGIVTCLWFCYPLTIAGAIAYMVEYNSWKPGDGNQRLELVNQCCGTTAPLKENAWGVWTWDTQYHQQFTYYSI